MSRKRRLERSNLLFCFSGEPRRRLVNFFCFGPIVTLRCGPTMWQLAKEFLMFLRQEKKWWLAPLVAVLLVLGALIVFGAKSVFAPFMYPFM